MITQLTDKPNSSPNDEIISLQAVVQRHLCNQVRGFRLLVLNDGLVLLGQCSTYYAKQLAQHAVMTASEMPIIANQIEVLSGQLRRG